MRVGLDHHPDERLGAARPQQHAALVAELGGRRGRPRRRPRRRPRLRAGGRGRCAAPAAAGSWRRRPARRAERPEWRTTSSSCTAVSRPSPVVARSPKITCPLCSPPSSRPRSAIAASTCWSPTGTSTTSMPCACHAATEPEVGHHGDDHGVAGEHLALVPVDGGDGDDLVAVDEPALGIDGERAVGVAVEGDADVGARGARRPPAAACGWVEPQPSLMFVPSGSAWSTSTRGAEAAQHPRGDARGGAVGGVDHHVDAVEPAAADGPEQRQLPALHRGRVVADGPRLGGAAASAPARGCGRARPRAPTSSSSDSLRPPGANSFTPLSW